jgi:hypothetical protein
MDQSQSAEHFSAERVISKFRDEYPFGVSNNYMTDITVSVGKHADLPADCA